MRDKSVLGGSVMKRLMNYNSYVIRKFKKSEEVKLVSMANRNVQEVEDAIRIVAYRTK